MSFGTEMRSRMPQLNDSVRALRTEIFSKDWPLDEEIRETAATLPSHSFLSNPSGQYPYIYLTRFVKALAERHFSRPFCDLSILDWGCGKGHVSKLIRDLADHDVRHRLTAGWLYNLPVGKGKRYMSSAHPVVDGFLGGWS